MKNLVLSILSLMILVSPCKAWNFNSIPPQEYPLILDSKFDQDTFFRHNTDIISIMFEIRNDIIISPAIGQLINMQSIELINDQPIDDPIEIYNVTIPLELINLPNLRSLSIRGKINLHFPFDTKLAQIQSRIEEVSLTFGWEKNSIPFLGELTELRQLELYQGEGIEFPYGFERLHNLQNLSITNHPAQPFILDERICGLTKLENLELNSQLKYPLPSCINRLTQLKEVTMAACRRELLPDGTAIQFPVPLTTLPNLEILRLWDASSIEMPNAPYGLNNLHTLVITEYPDSAIYDLCAGIESDYQLLNDKAYWGRPLKLDAVANYPKLQKLILNTLLDLDISLIENERNDYPYGYTPEFPIMTIGSNIEIHELTILAIRRFLDLIDTAWKAGKLPDLNQIRMWYRGNEDLYTIAVWERPASIEISGITLPKDNANWLLEKEWYELTKE